MVNDEEKALGDFLIALGKAGPMLVFLGRYLQTGRMSSKDAMGNLFALLGPIIFQELVDRFLSSRT